MATGTGNLPNPGMSFTPFDILTAAEMNDLVENIEALATGSGIGDGAIGASDIADNSLTPSKINTSSMTYVRATRSATQSISNNTITVVVYNTESVDSLNEYNTTTGVFTAAYSGFRTFSAGFRYQEATNASINGIRFYLNSTQLIEDNNANSVVAFFSRNLSVRLYMVAGDTMDIRAQHNAGSTRTIDNNVNNTYLIISA